jgi:hypothetical protein
MMEQAVVDADGIRMLFYSGDPNFPFTDFAFWHNGRLVLIQVTTAKDLIPLDP